MSFQSSPALPAPESSGFSAVPSVASASAFVGIEGTAQNIAVLYARSNSIYKTIPECDVFDLARNALTFSGSCPVIAHPPCRLWGRLIHLSTAPDSERQLAFHSVDLVRANGGVLEHPAHSKLWASAGLPSPGARDVHGGFTLPILQSWFGHKAPKATWLYVVGIEPAELPDFPFQLGIPAGRVELLSKNQREATPIDFALWLVDLAQRIAAKHARFLSCCASTTATNSHN